MGLDINWDIVLFSAPVADVTFSFLFFVFLILYKQHSIKLKLKLKVACYGILCLFTNNNIYGELV